VLRAARFHQDAQQLAVFSGHAQVALIAVDIRKHLENAALFGRLRQSFGLHCARRRAPLRQNDRGGGKSERGAQRAAAIGVHRFLLAGSRSDLRNGGKFRVTIVETVSARPRSNHTNFRTQTRFTGPIAD